MHLRSLLASTSLLLAAAAFPADAPPREIKLRTGVDNAVKFDLGTINAAAGESLKIVLTNASTLPKEVMGHNWVLLVPGTDAQAFANAGAAEKDNGYIAEKWKDKVVARIKVLGPNETGETVFTVPSKPGTYPFVCSFPGHCLIGMKGTLVVK